MQYSTTHFTKLWMIVVAWQSLISFVQGQEYLIGGPAIQHYIPSYQRTSTNSYVSSPQEVPSFRQRTGQNFDQLDSYLPQRDLQTSDLPFHLQQTLPQYRITTKPPQQFPFQYHNSPGIPFRPSQQFVVPSTHRPNYPHPFSHVHSNNPSQPETFLGEVTLQNAGVEISPPQQPSSTINIQNGRIISNAPTSSNRFNNNVNQNLDFTEKPNTSNVAVKISGTKPTFLTQRTRILAPESNDKQRIQTGNYFVSNNGDVFNTPNSRTESTRNRNATPTTWASEKPQNGPILFQKPATATSSVLIHKPVETKINIDSLLEEPLKESSRPNDDHVEVIHPPIETTNSSVSKEVEPAVNSDAELEYEYDDFPLENEDYYTNSEDEHKENNSIQNEHNDVADGAEVNDENYESDILFPSPEKYDKELSQQVSNEGTTSEKPVPIVTSVPKPNPVKTNSRLPVTQKGNEKIAETKGSDLRNNSGIVFSVVTTKSVVNNTVIAPATPMPPVTEKITSTSPSIETNTTDGWVVVASVQTSRSVSGARYLPSSIVEQDERVKLLNEEPTQQIYPEIKQRGNKSSNRRHPASTTDRSSTESLIDKLDRVQSDLSSSLLSNNFKADNDKNIAVIRENLNDSKAGVVTKTPLDLKLSHDMPKALKNHTITKSTVNRPVSTTTTKRPKAIYDNIKQVDVARFLPKDYKPNLNTTKSIIPNITSSQDDSTTKATLGNVKVTIKDDLSLLLPPGYKANNKDSDNVKLVEELLNKLKSQEKPSTDTLKDKANVSNRTKDLKEIRPQFKQNKTVSNTESRTVNTTESKIRDVFHGIRQDDISAFLPPGYKTFKTSTEPTSTTNKLKAITQEDISSKLLPAGYKSPKITSTTSKPKGIEGLLSEAKPVDISAFLPPGYKAKFKSRTENSNKQNQPKAESTTTTTPQTITEISISSTAVTSTVSSSTSGGFKVVFPSRPGGVTRKNLQRVTTPKTVDEQEENKPMAPAIHKGWPSRATTEFTGWPTPSTTPISIEKLLEAARTASTSNNPELASTSTAPSTVSTTTTTTTTTTVRPTTPGICLGNCDLVGTIKLIGGAKWVPELIDRNTKEWQILANEVQTQLENVFSKSNVLNKWYRKIRIDGFSEGSVLVDYLVELNDLGRQIDTLEIKTLFHDSLNDVLEHSTAAIRSPKALNDTETPSRELHLGNFIVDPQYTDFIVLPKQIYPTVGYAEENVLLPQWAIAVIVIGLASLLFVIIFGVTVLVNRQKSSKKKVPTPLSDDMLNELNKNHMGGFDNYGVDDMYNVEDGWNDRSYDSRVYKKRSSGSIHDNSTANLYDSWKSECNGYYYNGYWNHPGSSHAGYGRRRSDYDTNF